MFSFTSQEAHSRKMCCIITNLSKPYSNSSCIPILKTRVSLKLLLFIHVSVIFEKIKEKLNDDITYTENNNQIHITLTQYIVDWLIR